MPLPLQRRGSRKAKASKPTKPSEPADGPGHDPEWLESAWRSRTRQRLLKWFDANKRSMPWRTSFDPPHSQPNIYHVWVSEIMLQQTQVATVIPYFDRFIKAFPTIADLAKAKEPRLMKHWEGLGYYRRARSLHAAAQQIVADYGGEFPTKFEDAIGLKGIGRYTAGAILSIATDQKLPILEGNTVRVFSRWIALRDTPTEKRANELLWQVSEKMLPRKGSGRFNQAAMELGALICTPRSPKCDACPVQKQCRAHHLGLEQEIPGRISKTKYEDRTEFAMVIQNRTGFLMQPLPEGSRWAGLWDFPRPTHTVFTNSDDVAKWLSNEIGRDVQTGSRIRSIKHAVTKYRITLHVHAADMETSRKKLPVPWKFVSLNEMADLPMSVTARKICEHLQKDRQPMLSFSNAKKSR